MKINDIRGSYYGIISMLFSEDISSKLCFKFLIPSSVTKGHLVKVIIKIYILHFFTQSHRNKKFLALRAT